MPYYFLLLLLSIKNQNTIQYHGTINKDVNLIVTDTSCFPPENYGVVNITSHRTRFVWTDVPAASQFRVKLTQSNNVILDTLLEKTHRYDLSTLQPETNYKIQITSICGNEMSIPSDWIEWKTTALPECQIPMNLNVPWTTDSSASLDWMPTPSTTGYLIFFKQTRSIIWDSLLSNTAGTTLRNLNASNAYQIRVKAICGSRQSEMTSIIAFNTPASRICEKPLPPKLDALNQNEARWRWNKTKHATGYQVWDRLPHDSAWRTWQVKDTVISVPIRVPGKAMEMMVRSLCKNSRSEFTPIVRTNTLPILDTSDVHESNDNPQSASLIFPPLNIKGNLFQEKDEDWFRFEIPACGSNLLFVISNASENLELRAMNDTLQPILLHKLTNKHGSNFWKGSFQVGINYIRISRRIDSNLIDLNSQINEAQEFRYPDSNFQIQSTSIIGHGQFDFWDTVIWTIRYTGTYAINLKRFHVLNNETGENYPTELMKTNTTETYITDTQSNAESILPMSQCLIQQGETFYLKLVVPANTLTLFENDIITPISIYLEHMELPINLNYHLKVDELDLLEKVE